MPPFDTLVHGTGTQKFKIAKSVVWCEVDFDILNRLGVTRGYGRQIDGQTDGQTDFTTTTLCGHKWKIVTERCICFVTGRPIYTSSDIFPALYSNTV